MEFFHETHLDFIGKRRIAFIMSLTVIVLAIASLALRGLNYGIDFTGGTLIEIAYNEPIQLDQVRAKLATAGFADAVVQNFGTPQDALVRIPPRGDETSAAISNRVLRALPGAEMRRVEFVGPQVGDELTEQGGLAMLYALIGILIYVAVRFERRFALGAVAALIHDVIITLGVLSIVGMNFDLPVVAALLAVIGYSLNDTIVVFDRIRENFRKMRREDAAQIMNVSINQTLSRTIITGLTTLVVLFALFALGGELMQPFAATLIIGILVGTYSSVYVASALSLVLGVSRQDLMPIPKEGADADNRP
jgi:preprotein translocase subunit SecF